MGRIYKVFCSMHPFRGITTSYVTTGYAETKSNPISMFFLTFFTTRCCRNNIFPTNISKMATRLFDANSTIIMFLSVVFLLLELLNVRNHCLICAYIKEFLILHELYKFVVSLEMIK